MRFLLRLIMRPLLFLSLFLLTACSTTTSSKQPLVLTEQQNNDTVNLTVGDEFIVQLKENPTTGYQWAVDVLPEQLALEKDEYHADPAPAMMVGSGGKKMFIFKVKKAGTATLKLKEWRSWEGDKSIVERFDLTIQAK